MDDRGVLSALVTRLIPADAFPSAAETGVPGFIESISASNAGPSAPWIGRGLELLDEEAFKRHARAFAQLDAVSQDRLIADLLESRTAANWKGLSAQDFIALMIRLTAQGYYGNPSNGGNRGGASWTMIGYRVLEPGRHWPPVDRTPPPLTAWNDLKDRYDAVVVGAGAGGGVVACVLAERGRRVLLVERGSWLTPPDPPRDHLRSQSAWLGYDADAGPPAEGNPRVLAAGGNEWIVSATSPAWQNVAMTVGGGTRVYGAQAWRFCPQDFHMATTYGVPEGSSLADWPIGYEDLEPFYDRAEWEIGVAGDASGNRAEGFRSRGYPTPPLPANRSSSVLRAGADALGLTTGPVPLLINSVPRGGRGACLQCGECLGFGCPGDYKNGTQNTVIERALATGRCDLLTETQAERLMTDARGAVTGVALVTDQGGLRRQNIRADNVVLTAGAIETARLLLNSTSTQEPHGIGNRHDQVGRNLQGHVYTGAIGVFEEPIQDCVGPRPSIATNDFRHHNPGLIGGGMIANDFVPAPIKAWEQLTSLGAIPEWGEESKRGMRDLYSRFALVMGPIQEISNPQSRVTVATRVRDHFGIPAARLSGSLHSEDLRAAAFLRERAAEWLQASGARQVYRLPLPSGEYPSGGQHQAGTCRMGDDPRCSVTDPYGRIWGHENVYVADGSLHVTNGGVNPVLTILANAYRVSEHIGL